MKDFDKDKELPCLPYWDLNDLYGWARSQQIWVDNCEWIEDTSQFNDDFIKAIMNISISRTITWPSQ